MSSISSATSSGLTTNTSAMEENLSGLTTNTSAKEKNLSGLTTNTSAKEKNLSQQMKYWLTEAKHDLFFVVGTDYGPTEKIGVIKDVLLGYSEPLRSLLKSTKDQKDIHLNDVEPQTFKTFLKCIYGTANSVIPNLSLDESAKLLDLVERFSVSDIEPKVVSHLNQQMLRENLSIALSYPACLKADDLTKEMKHIFESNMGKIISDERLFSLKDTLEMWILEQDLESSEDMKFWNAIVKWSQNHIESNSEKLSPQIVEVLKNIHYIMVEITEPLQNASQVDGGVSLKEKASKPCTSNSSPPNVEPCTSKSSPPNVEPSTSKSSPPNVEPCTSKSSPPNVEPCTSKSSPPDVEPCTSKSSPSNVEPCTSKSSPPNVEPSTSSSPPNVEPCTSKSSPSNVELCTSKSSPPNVEPCTSKSSPPNIEKECQHSSPHHIPNGIKISCGRMIISEQATFSCLINIADLGENIGYSDWLEFCGYSWRVIFSNYKEASDYYISCYLNCKSKNSTWSCLSSIDFILINLYSGSNHSHSFEDVLFDEKYPYWGVTKLHYFHNLTRFFQYEFVMDDCIILMVRFKCKNS